MNSMELVTLVALAGALTGQLWLLMRWWRKHHSENPDSRFSFVYFWKTIPSLVIWYEMVLRLTLKQVWPDIPVIGLLAIFCFAFMFGSTSMVLFKELENIAKKWFKVKKAGVRVTEGESKLAVIIVAVIVYICTFVGVMIPPDVQAALIVLLTFLIALLGLKLSG